jgi:hypothetical protein
MTKALSEAVARRPPHGASTTTSSPNRAVTKTATTNTTTAAVSLGLSANGSGAYFTFAASQDAHIRFGPSTVAACTTGDYLLRAGVAEEFWCESNEDTHFTAIRDAADGSIYWWRSGG